MRVKRGSHSTLVDNKCSLQFSRSVMSDSLPPHGLQHDRLPVHHQILSLLKFMSIKSVMPSNHLILYHPLLLLLSIFPRVRVFLKEPILHMRWPKYWNFSFNISPSNEYSGLICFTMYCLGSSCCPRDSQESFPTPQFKSINSLALSFPYSPTLTSIHDYWKNHSFDGYC